MEWRSWSNAGRALRDSHFSRKFWKEKVVYDVGFHWGGSEVEKGGWGPATQRVRLL